MSRAEFPSSAPRRIFRWYTILGLYNRFLDRAGLKIDRIVFRSAVFIWRTLLAVNPGLMWNVAMCRTHCARHIRSLLFLRLFFPDLGNYPYSRALSRSPDNLFFSKYLRRSIYSLAGIVFTSRCCFITKITSHGITRKWRSVFDLVWIWGDFEIHYELVIRLIASRCSESISKLHRNETPIFPWCRKIYLNPICASIFIAKRDGIIFARM